MKKMLAWLLSLSMLLAMVPAVSAEGREGVFSVGETEYAYSQDASGDGWSYDAGSLTITLNGVKEFCLDLESAPEGVKIELATGSENEFWQLNLPWNGYEDSEGDYVTVSGDGILCSPAPVYGSLQVDSGTVEIDWITGALLVNGGDVTIGSIKAAPAVVVNGGSLTINKLDTYAYEQTGGTVRAATMSNCNGTDLDSMSYEISGGKFILDDSEMEYQSDLGAFFCLATHAKSREFKWEFENFANCLVDENGEPLELKYFGYDENGEAFENPRNNYEGMLYAILCKEDGTPAHYAEYSPMFTFGGEEYSFTRDASGDGWSYDAESQALTLNGVEMGGDPDDYSEDNGFDFSNAPAGVQIVLATGSDNTLDSVTVTEGREIPVSGEGTLNAGTYGGTLVLNSGSVNVGSMYGSVTVNGGSVSTQSLVYGDLTMNSGTANLKGTKASGAVIINGGDLTIEELDAYTYEQYGGTVKAARMTNCNGIDVSLMKYVLAGGSLILNNIGTEYEEWDSVFSCVAQPGSSYADFRQVLSPFDGTMVDEDGNPVSMKFVGYDENDEQVDMNQLPASYSGHIYARLFSADGTLANSARLVVDGACEHEASYLRSDFDSHWYVCGKCGCDVEDTRTAHVYTSYGPVNYCACGNLTTELELNSESGGLHDEDVTREIVELGLKMWLGENRMAYAIMNTIDYDWEGITLEKIARLQLLAEGVEVPEEYAAFGMTYQEDKSVDSFSVLDDLSGNWDTVKVFVLDPVTFAPLTDPIEISK